MRPTSDPYVPPPYITGETSSAALSDFLTQDFVAPEGKAGTGVIICGGGLRYFTCAYVCIRMLRQLGCTLPVQLWHLGEMEILPGMAESVAGLDVEFINAFEVQSRHPCRILNGYELKPYTLLHSRFRHVLYLDADNVPIVDPSFLFETPEYADAGAIFWPDYSRLEPTREIWDLCEVEYRDEPEIESGQIVIDTVRCWRALKLTMFMNEYSDFYFEHIHGDKETFHLAFHRTGTPYHMPPYGIHSLDSVMCQHDFTGRRIFQHRNMDKWSYDLSNLRIDDFQYEDLCFKFIKDLRSRLSRAPDFSLHSRRLR
jgi:hypothetical protein